MLGVQIQGSGKVLFLQPILLFNFHSVTQFSFFLLPAISRPVSNDANGDFHHELRRDRILTTAYSTVVPVGVLCVPYEDGC